MANYTVTNQGDPIIPYELDVEFTVNRSVTENSTWVTATPYPSTAFSDAVNTHTQNWENAIKTAPEFSTQDTNRNGSWSVVAIGPNYDDPAKTDYALTTACTVENAVVNIPQSMQSDKTGAALDAELQAAADSKESEFYANRPLWV